MIINMNMGSIDKDIDKDRATVLYSDLEKNTAPKIPAPPPPPPPITTFLDSSRSILQNCDQKPRSRLRNFNWEAIPLEKVKGRISLWSSETFQEDLHIDTGKMEELFGKQKEEVLPKSCQRRRSISVGDTCLNKVFLLDSRRSMNIGIFLKQFKRSAAEIVEDIKLGRGDMYSSERLNELLKHLPDREEVQRLKSFQGDRERLSEADLFMLLLLDLPCYFLRLEALILKKDFCPAVLSQLSAARDLTTAAEELLQCTELHFILKLVLKAGNFMNAGGYAGNAAGFRVSSLLKLADTKANKPGMNLMHFVVMEVQKNDPRSLSFVDKLQHVHSASKLSEDGLLEEFYRLQSRISSIHQTLSVPELQELRQQMEEFLEYADHQLQEVQKEIDALQVSRQNLCEFLCEDEDVFRLEECCKVFSCFCQKFQLAMKENKHREQEDLRRKEWEKKRLQKRHSMATCSALEASQSKDELELTLERNLCYTRRPYGRRMCRMRSLGWNNAKPFISCNDQGGEHCDQRSADQMRKVSERVLRQQMEYKSQKSVSIYNNNKFYQLPVERNSTSCHSEAKVDLHKVSLLLPKEKTEIFQLPPEAYGHHVSDQPLNHHSPRYSEVQQHMLCNRNPLQNMSELLDNSLPQSDVTYPNYVFLSPTEKPQALIRSLDSVEEHTEQLLNSHSVDHFILEASKTLHEKEMPFPQESYHSEPKCDSQIILKPQPVYLDYNNVSQSQTQFNYICPKSGIVSDNVHVQIPMQVIENSDLQTGDQSYLPRQMFNLSALKTFTYLEGLIRPNTLIQELNTRSVIQCISGSSMQAVAEEEVETESDFKETSGGRLRNDHSLQILDNTESKNPDQSLDLQRLKFSKQTNGLIVSESSSAPKTSKSLAQITSKTMKQTLVKSVVRGTRHSEAIPGTQVSSPSSIPTRLDVSNQNQRTNKSETLKPRRSQPGCFMSKIKFVEPLADKQSLIKELNDHIPPPRENTVDSPNVTSRGLQYAEYNSFSKGVKDIHSPVQKDFHSPCSKWKRELRNTSEKTSGVRVEPMLENGLRSNRNGLEHKSGDTIKSSSLGRNGRITPKRSKTNDLGIRRVPLTKDIAVGSVSPSVIKYPVATPRHTQKDGKDSKIPQKISLSAAGVGKSISSKNMGTFKEKEGSHVNNNDCGKYEGIDSPSITSKHSVPSSLRGEVWTSQMPPKKSTSVARVAIHVIKHCEVNSTVTRGTRNTYMDNLPIWR